MPHSSQDFRVHCYTRRGALSARDLRAGYQILVLSHWLTWLRCAVTGYTLTEVQGSRNALYSGAEN